MIAPGFVEDALDCLRQQGKDVRPVLRAAGLPDALNEPVSAETYGRLWLAMAAATGDEFFGLGARPMRPGSFALLCHAVLHAGTLDRALRRSLKFLRVVLDDPHGRLSVTDGQAQVVLSDGGVARSAFAYRTFWLVLLGVSCWLIGRRIPLRQVDFACPPPAHRADYRLFFGAPVRFHQPASRLCFDAAYLKLPTIRSEAALDTFLRGAPGNLLLRYRHDAGPAAAVRALLREVPPADWPRFEEMASRLRIPPATLRRRLGAAGQSYGSIKDEIRNALAQQMLRETRQDVAGIATELGYSEPSAFHRAFRKWTGQSPGNFRRMLTDRSGKAD